MTQETRELHSKSDCSPEELSIVKRTIEVVSQVLMVFDGEDPYVVRSALLTLLVNVLEKTKASVDEWQDMASQIEATVYHKRQSHVRKEGKEVTGDV